MLLTSLEEASFANPRPVSPSVSFSCTPGLASVVGFARMEDFATTGVDTGVVAAAAAAVVTITTSDITTSGVVTTDGYMQIKANMTTLPEPY